MIFDDVSRYDPRSRYRGDFDKTSPPPAHQVMGTPESDQGAGYKVVSSVLNISYQNIQPDAAVTMQIVGLENQLILERGKDLNCCK